MEEEYLNVIPLGTMPKREEITMRIMIDTLDSLNELYNKEKSPMESFDSYVNRLLDEAIKYRKIDQ